MRFGIVTGGMTGPGSGSWTRFLALIEALLAQPEVSVFVYAPPDLANAVPPQPGLHVRHLRRRSTVGRVVWTGRDVRRATRADRLDVLHFETVPLPRRVAVATLVSLHDVREFHREVPQHIFERLLAPVRRSFIKSAARRADGVVTLTSWSRADLVRCLGVEPSKVMVVPYSRRHWAEESQEPLRESGSSEPFVLVLGHLEWRKNVATVVRAALRSEWPDGVRLVVAGADHGEGPTLSRLADSSDGRVELVGPVSESEKWRLLAGAALVLVPSFVEGFGIVVCEAVEAGTPVLVADRSALPEVVGVDSAVLPATDDGQWAATVRRLLASAGRRQQLLEEEIASMARFRHDAVGADFVQRVERLLACSASRVDVVHLAYAGLGGHRAVVEGLVSEQREMGILSAGVLVGPLEVLPAEGWIGLERSLVVPLRRRGDISSMFAVARSVRRLRSPIVVAHTHRHLPAAWLGMLLAGRRPRVVLVEHQTLPLRNRLDDLWSLIGVCLSSAVVLLSQNYLDGYRWAALAKRLRTPVSVIGNGVAVPHGAISRGGETHPFTFGMACRLIPTKDVSSVIGALEHLRRGGGDWRCRIAGDGPERASLEALADRIDCRDLVKFDGAIDRSQMSVWFAGLDCYVQASRGETMSMSVLEAAANALPIIVSDVPGVRDVLTDGVSAIILRETTPQAIAAAIERVRTDPSIVCLGDRAQAVVEADHSMAAMAAAYTDVFRSIGGLGAVPVHA